MIEQSRRERLQMFRRDGRSTTPAGGAGPERAEKHHQCWMWVPERQNWGEISSQASSDTNGKPGFEFLKEQIQYQDHGARAEHWEADRREVWTGSSFRGEGDPGLLSLVRWWVCGECRVHLGFESERHIKSRSQPPEAWSVSLMVCGQQAWRDL